MLTSLLFAEFKIELKEVKWDSTSNTKIKGEEKLPCCVEHKEIIGSAVWDDTLKYWKKDLGYTVCAYEYTLKFI